MLGSSGNLLGISEGLPIFWSPYDEAASYLTAADDLIATNRATTDFQALLDLGRTSGAAPFAQGHPELLHIARSDTAGNFGGLPNLTIFAGATFDSFMWGGKNVTWRRPNSPTRRAPNNELSWRSETLHLLVAIRGARLCGHGCSGDMNCQTCCCVDWSQLLVVLR